MNEAKAVSNPGHIKVLAFIVHIPIGLMTQHLTVYWIFTMEAFIDW